MLSRKANKDAKQGYMRFARLLFQPVLMVIATWLAMVIVNPLLSLAGGFVTVFADSLSL